MTLQVPRPSSATHPAGATDSVAQLLEFLRDRDVSCPRCGYNLRNLSRPQCPECLEDLALTVGFERPPIGWLLATITPCTFSGIAAALLLIPIIVGPLMGGGPAPWFVLVTNAFGWLSGLFALLLARHRHAFLRMPRQTQVIWAVATWAVHVAAFIVLLSVVLQL